MPGKGEGRNSDGTGQCGSGPGVPNSVCEVEKVSVPVGLGEGYSSPSLPVWQASSPSLPCALLLPCRGSGSANKEEGEPEAGDRASLAGEAAGAQQAASVKLQFTLKN